MGHEVGSELASWSEVEDEAEWSSLLLGNGFSRHLWAGFKYSSLFDRAVDASYLDDTDHQLFDAFNTENIELVLSALSTSIVVADVLGDSDRAPVRSLHEHPAGARKAVREVHPGLDEIKRETRESVRQILREYGRVFTTSYDFCSTGARALASSPSTGSKTSFGIRGLWSLMPPTLASARVGLRASTTCTARCISQSTDGNKLPLVVFGHTLGEQDDHLVRALNRLPDRPIAVGMRDHGKDPGRFAGYSGFSMISTR